MVGKESKILAGEEAQILMSKVNSIVSKFTNSNVGVIPLKFLEPMITIEQKAQKLNIDIGDWLARTFGVE